MNNIFIISVFLCLVVIICTISITAINKEKQKTIAIALIQFIQIYKNLNKVLEKNNIDTSTSETFNLLTDFYNMIIENCCISIDNDCDESDNYNYSFDFKTIKNVSIDLEFITLNIAYAILLLEQFTVDYK